MNTNNNLDEKNLTIDTENKEMHPEPEVPVQESKVDTPQAEQVQEAVQTDKTDEVALEEKQEVTGISDLKLVEETDGSNVGSAQSDVEATVSEEADEQKEKEQEKLTITWKMVKQMKRTIPEMRLMNRMRILNQTI